MTSCEVIALSGKACSGKCRTGSCQNPALWVLATCDGEMALFQKHGDHLAPVTLKQPMNMLDGMREHLVSACREGDLQQLVVIGSSKDISWLHHLLPEVAARHIIAEIDYPLIPEWFQSHGKKLAQVLMHVV